MKHINRSEIYPVKMATKPSELIVNCGMKVINTDGFVYEYIGIGWIKCEQASKNDYLNIPQLCD